MLRLPSSWIQRLSQPKCFWIFLGFGLLIRVLWIIWQVGEPLLGDGYEYAHEARVIGAEYFTSAYWPPFLPHYLLPWTWLPGDSDTWMRLSMLPWFALLAFEFRKTIGKWLNPAAAHAALALVAVYPAFILHGAEPLSQVPAAVLFLATARHLTAPSRSATLKAGLFLSLLVLLRPSAFLLAIAGPILLTIRHKRKIILLAAAMPLLAASLWSFSVSSYHGYPIWINRANTVNLYLGNNAWTPLYKTWYYGSHWLTSPDNPKGFTDEVLALQALPQAEQSSAYLKKAIQEWQSSPGRSLLRTSNRMRTFWAFDSLAGARYAGPHDPHPILGYLLLGLDALCFGFLMLGALFSFLRTPRYRLLMWAGLLYAIPYFFSFSHPTFHMPVAALWLIPALSCWTRSQGIDLPLPKRPWAIVLGVVFALIQIEWVWQMLQPGF